MFYDDELYSDEKLAELLDKITDKKVKEDFKLMVHCINNYNSGRIFEKEKEIYNLKEKKKTRIIISLIGYIAGVIGFVSSIVTIFHL